MVRNEEAAGNETSQPPIRGGVGHHSQSSYRGRPRYIPFSIGSPRTETTPPGESGVVFDLNNLTLGHRTPHNESRGTNAWGFPASTSRGGRGGGRGASSSRGRQSLTSLNWRERSVQSATAPRRSFQETYTARSGAKYFEATFHPWSRLLEDLQWDIIKLHVENDARLIEMEHASVEGGVNYLLGPHERYRVAARSRAPPAVLQVSRLIRQQALSLYHLCYFDSFDFEQKRPIYFRNNTDIILFGDNTCIVTLVRFLQRDHVARGNGHVRNIAIMCSAKGQLCCDLDEPTYGIDGGVSIFHAMHGFDNVVVHYPDWRVHNMVKEVYFIIKTDVWYHDAGQMDASVALRPAHNEGLTKGQRSFKQSAEETIENLKAGKALGRVGQNLWLGNNMPNFSFVGYCPKLWGPDPRVYDAICVPIDAYKLLTRNFIRDLENRTRVQITRGFSRNPAQDPKEYGLFGEAVNIEAAKEEIMKLIA